MLTKKINARGNAIIYAYDAWRQLISSSAGTQFSYDEFGKITSVSDAAGTREFTYDTFGELETETCGNAAISELRDNFGHSLGYVYSKSGTAQQTTSVGYDSASGRIASAGFLHGGNVKNFTYNYLAGTDLLAQLVCPNNMSQNLTYETARDLLVGMNYKRGTTDVVIRNYAYDNLSRPISRSTARQGSVQNDTFAYNSRSELVAGTLGGNAFNFVFDEIGNQTQFACNATNETTIEGDFVPAYDADGNAILIKTATGTWSVSYNAENRPIRFECAGTQTVVEMNYDYLGRRFEKKITVAGTTTLHHRYIYRGFLQIACLDLTRAGTPALWFVFWDPTQPTGTRPLAIQKNGTWFVYGHDLTKNVCEVFGSDGYIKTTYSYSPFGNVSSIGNFEQNFQWSSEFYDPELDLVYYNYRHYSPTTARWLSRDPIEERGGLNLYCFCGNNGISKYDLKGKFVFGGIEGPDFDVAENSSCCLEAKRFWKFAGYSSFSKCWDDMTDLGMNFSSTASARWATTHPLMKLVVSVLGTGYIIGDTIGTGLVCFRWICTKTKLSIKKIRRVRRPTGDVCYNYWSCPDKTIKK